MIKPTLVYFWELLKVFILAMVIVVPIRYFLFQPFIVKGDSMLPNFNSGDYLIVDEISYRFSEPERGDVVVFRYPKDPTQRFIKRIIGLPGETIEIKDGKITITQTDGSQIILDEDRYLSEEQQITSGSVQMAVPDNEYFVLGDNRAYSSDSRFWGLLPRKDLIGKAFVRLLPVTSFAKITSPSY